MFIQNDWVVFFLISCISTCNFWLIYTNIILLELQYFIITLSHFLINRSHYLRYNLVLSLIDQFFLSFMAEWIWQHHHMSTVLCWYWSNGIYTSSTCSTKLSAVTPNNQNSKHIHALCAILKFRSFCFLTMRHFSVHNSLNDWRYWALWIATTAKLLINTLSDYPLYPDKHPREWLFTVLINTLESD